MNTIELSEGHQETAIEAKPRFMSGAWFKSLFSALAMHKYSPRDWGINILSSIMSYVNAAVLATIAVKYPWISAIFKAVWGGIVSVAKWLWALVIALFHAATN